MSREIKFRAKRLNNNQFVIGYYLPMVYGYKHYIYLPLEYLNEHSRIEIDPKTLGQYTGLKDKNGKEIYEGDILKFAYGDRLDVYEHSIIMLIEYRDGTYGGSNKVKLGTQLQPDKCSYYEYSYRERADDYFNKNIELGRHEVIGNIYENPELLKEGEIGDTIRIVHACPYGIKKETVGKIEGYQTNDSGVYIKLIGQTPIFMESITDWEILKIDNIKQ